MIKLQSNLSSIRKRTWDDEFGETNTNENNVKKFHSFNSFQCNTFPFQIQFNSIQNIPSQPQLMENLLQNSSHPSINMNKKRDREMFDKNITQSITEKKHITKKEICQPPAYDETYEFIHQYDPIKMVFL